MKYRFVCLLAALLLLSACGKEGTYYIDGQFIRGTSGRNYLIYETDVEGTWYVLLEDASEAGDLLTDVEIGSFISVQCAPHVDQNDYSHYTPIYSCDVKQKWKSKEIPAEHQEEIDRIDTLYQEAET